MRSGDMIAWKLSCAQDSVQCTCHRPAFQCVSCCTAICHSLSMAHELAEAGSGMSQ